MIARRTLPGSLGALAFLALLLLPGYSLVACAETPESQEAPAAASTESSAAAKPNLQAVLAGYRAAVGGDAWARVEGLHSRGIYVLNGIEHPLEIWQLAAPPRIRWEAAGLHRYGAEVIAGHKAVRVWDGERAWIIQPDQSLEPEVLTRQRAASLIARADPHPSLLDPEAQVEWVGSTLENGAEVYQLKLTPKDGEVEHWFLSATTHLPLRRVSEPDAEGLVSTWFYEDYREVEGIRLPFYTLVEGNLFAPEEILESVTLNPKVPEGFFEMPGQEGEAADEGR